MTYSPYGVIPQGNIPVQAPSYSEQFFRALLEGRVSLVPASRKGAFRVSVSAPVKDEPDTDPNQLTLD